MNNFPVNIEDYFARVLNIKMCMRKIFYPILLLALVACKGQQQTADSESVADAFAVRVLYPLSCRFSHFLIAVVATDLFTEINTGFVGVV